MYELNRSNPIGYLLNFPVEIAAATSLYQRWISHDSRNLELSYAQPFGDQNFHPISDGDSMLAELRGLTPSSLVLAAQGINDVALTAQLSHETVSRIDSSAAECWQGNSAEEMCERLKVLRGTLEVCNQSLAQFSFQLNNLAVEIDRIFLDIASEIQHGAYAEFRAGGFSDNYLARQHLFIDKLGAAIDAAVEENDAFPDVTQTRLLVAQAFRSAQNNVEVNGQLHSWGEFCAKMDSFALLYSEAVAQYRNKIEQAHEAVSGAVRIFCDAMKNVDFSFTEATFLVSDSNFASRQGNKMPELDIVLPMANQERVSTVVTDLLTTSVSGNTSESTISPNLQSTVPADQSSVKPAEPRQIPLGSTDVISAAHQDNIDNVPAGTRRLLELGDAPVVATKRDERRVMGEPPTLPKQHLYSDLPEPTDTSLNYSAGRINRLLDNDTFG